MPCGICPEHRHTYCESEGCCARLAETRVQSCVGTYREEALAKARDQFGLPPVEEAVDRQVARLDVEDGDILTVRTRSKLTAEKSKAWQEELLALCRSQGFHHVSVIVLDDCTDLTIERPRKAPTGMQHQHVRPFAITSY